MKKINLYILYFFLFLLIPSLIFLFGNFFRQASLYSLSENINEDLIKIFPLNKNLEKNITDSKYLSLEEKREKKMKEQELKNIKNKKEKSNSGSLGTNNSDKELKNISKEYGKILRNYQKQECKGDNCNNIFDYTLNHNIGNSYYRLGEFDDSLIDKREFWYKSLEYYDKALDIKEDEETIKNYAFVKNKLNELEKKIEKIESQNKSQSSGSGSSKGGGNNGQGGNGNGGNQNQSGSTDGNSQGGTNLKNPKRNPSLKLDTNKNIDQEKLTIPELDDIKKEIQKLKNSENGNIKRNNEINEFYKRLEDGGILNNTF